MGNGRAAWILFALAALALPAYAQQPATDAGADPALAQQADPALVKLVPADMAGKPFTLAVAVGSAPDRANSRGPQQTLHVSVPHGADALTLLC